MNAQEQTATRLSADNCEVLRARLAKYEDSEGRPLASEVAQPAEPAAVDVVAYCEFAEHGNSRMWNRGSFHLLEAFEKQADPLITLASHNAEVERLRGESQAVGHACKILREGNSGLLAERDTLRTQLDQANALLSQAGEYGGLTPAWHSQRDAHLSASQST